MMSQYRRWPAVIVLIVASIAGTFFLRSSKASDSAATDSLGQLEAKIAQAKGNIDVTIWSAYAQKLAENNQFNQAAQAHRKVLEKEPSNRSAKIGCALALAQAGSMDDLYAYMRELAYGEAKLAIEIFDRRECQTCLKDARFTTLQKEAKAQAMD
jgi:hypothetical protein